MTGGGSGGHITPLLSLARELKRQAPDCQLVYIGHKGDQFDSLRASGHYFDFMAFVNAGKFRRYHGESIWAHLLDLKTLLLNGRDVFRVIKSTLQAYRILSHTKPDALFVKGGFVSVPVGLAARLKGIPIVTHDSDTVGGLANRIVGRWARVRATGMPAELYNYKAKYVGIPLDEHIGLVTPAGQAKFKQDVGLPAKARVLLVTGGGNGSKFLNDLISSAALGLLNGEPTLHIVHITGLQHEAAVARSYKAVLTPGQRARVHVFGFVGDLYKYSGAADLIISRAGATAVAEYAAQAKACIIIPSPFLAAGHQLKNAELLAGASAAVVLPEAKAGALLIPTVSKLLDEPARRRKLAANLHKLAKPGASGALAKILLAIANERR